MRGLLWKWRAGAVDLIISCNSLRVLLLQFTTVLQTVACRSAHE